MTHQGEYSDDGYYRSLNKEDAEKRPEYANYYSDDEIENMWANSIDLEDEELYFDEQE